MIEKLDELRIKYGDMILIHSNIFDIARFLLPKNPHDFCEIFYKYLVDKVGTEGTLVFPTFNFDFCSGKPFSIKETKSQMGSLSTYVLKRPEAIRTRHPIYSFAVTGKHAEYFSEIDNKSAYSDDSVFGEIRRRSGKIMIVDLSYKNSMTFFHHVEEMEKVNYKFYKDFTGIYIDYNGCKSMKTYSMYVRDMETIETDVEPMGELFEKSGFVKKIIFENGSFIKIMGAKELFDFSVENMKRDPYLLYKQKK